VSGYVRLYRSLVTEHPAFRNDSEALAFAWLVAKAAWQPTRVRYKERILRLERGQLAISQRDMARSLDRDKAWVERLWKRLKAEAMIRVDSEAGVALITICKYEEYQARGVGREALDEAPDEAGARQGQGTEQEREEVKKISSEPKGSSPRAWVCPAGTLPQVWADFLKNRSRKKLGTTPTAWKHFVDDLARVSLQTGIPPPELIERCTAKGWGAIYDPRDQRNDRSTANPLSEAVTRILGDSRLDRGAGEDAGAGSAVVHDLGTARALAARGG
jgi:hypothetical protein